MAGLSVGKASMPAGAAAAATSILEKTLILEASPHCPPPPAHTCFLMKLWPSWQCSANAQEGLSNASKLLRAGPVRAVLPCSCPSGPYQSPLSLTSLLCLHRSWCDLRAGSGDPQAQQVWGVAPAPMPGPTRVSIPRADVGASWAGWSLPALSCTRGHSGAGSGDLHQVNVKSHSELPAWPQ